MQQHVLKIKYPPTGNTGSPFISFINLYAKIKCN